MGGRPQAMNRRTLAAAGILPCLAVLALNLSAVHGHYAYSVPVAESAVDLYFISYITAEKDDYNYHVRVIPPREIHASEYPMAKNRTPGEFTIKSVAQAGGKTIRIDFADNNYTITNSESGLSYRPLPVFSHTETIRVNQTFVAMCNDVPRPWSDDGDSYGTPLVIYQYRGREVHEVDRVEQIVPVDSEDDVPEGASLIIHGDLLYSAKWKDLDPPKRISVHKFLWMSAFTYGEMSCDYPSVIRHTVDSKRVEPADVASFSGDLYDMYK